MAGGDFTGATTYQSGTPVSMISIVFELEKTQTAYAEDWFFIGELEVCGTP